MVCLILPSSQPPTLQPSSSGCRWVRFFGGWGCSGDGGREWEFSKACVGWPPLGQQTGICHLPMTTFMLQERWSQVLYANPFGILLRFGKL